LASFPSLNDLDLYPNFAEDLSLREALELFKDTRFKRDILQWELENPRKKHKLAQVLTDCFSQPPAHGILLRNNALISLVGVLEILLEALFFGYYFYVGDARHLDDAAAREEAARGQTDKAMRTGGGWRKRIEKFGKLGIGLEVVQGYLDEVVEMTQRRNLLVHNGGVIDATYMKCSPQAYWPAEAKEGRVLLAPPCYLDHAFDRIMLFAFGLSQACWRHWQPKKAKKNADKTADTLIYQTLRQGRHGLVRDLAQVADEMRLPWETRQHVLVNQVIALRELGEEPATMSLLSELIRRKREWRVTIALAVLQKDILKARLLLKRAADEGKLREVSPYWPLFDPIREESWFEPLFATPYHGPLPRNKKR
jgi:hypothetical protein